MICYGVTIPRHGPAPSTPSHPLSHHEALPPRYRHCLRPGLGQPARLRRNDRRHLFLRQGSGRSHRPRPARPGPQRAVAGRRQQPVPDHRRGHPEAAAGCLRAAQPGTAAGPGRGPGFLWRRARARRPRQSAVPHQWRAVARIDLRLRPDTGCPHHQEHPPDGWRAAGAVRRAHRCSGRHHHPQWRRARQWRQRRSDRRLVRQDQSECLVVGQPGAMELVPDWQLRPERGWPGEPDPLAQAAARRHPPRQSVR